MLYIYSVCSLHSNIDNSTFYWNIHRRNSEALFACSRFPVLNLFSLHNICCAFCLYCLVLLFFCALQIFNYSNFLAFLFIYNNYHFKIFNSLINLLERRIVYYKFCSIKCAAYDNTNSIENPLYVQCFHV